MLFSFERPDRKDSENQFTPHNFQLSVEDARLAFSSFDLNNDGYIDFTEFMVVFYCLSDGTPEEILQKIFRVFDMNSDGKITLDEIRNIVHSMFDLLKHNNPIQATEEFIAKTAFIEMDGNNDGEVDSGEFVKAALEQKEFTKLLTVNIMSIFN